jgi:hypothetical protein
MDVTRERHPIYYQYTIGGTPLEYVDQQRLLGIEIMSDLRSQAHTDEVRGRAAKNLAFIKRNLRGCKKRVKNTAYLLLVKPIITYGLPAIPPTKKIP